MKENATGLVAVTEIIQELHELGMLDNQQCEHLIGIQDIAPLAAGCNDCLTMGDSWVHLRLCLTCGYVGCCDDSKNKHATRHHHTTNHPMIISYEEGEEWMWCYLDEVLFHS